MNSGASEGSAVPAPIETPSCYCFTTRTSSDMEIVLDTSMQEIK